MRAAEVSFFQMRAGEASSFQICATEVGFFRTRDGEVSFFQMYVDEDGFFQMRAGEVGLFQTRAEEVGFFQMRFREVRPLKSADVRSNLHCLHRSRSRRSASRRLITINTAAISVGGLGAGC